MVPLWANPTYGALWRSNRRPIYHRNGRQEKQKLEVWPTNRRSSQHQEIQLRAWERHEWRLRLICDNDTMATRFQQTRKMTGGGPGSSLPHLVLIMSKYGHMSNHLLSLLIPNCPSLTLNCPFVLLPFKFCLSLSSFSFHQWIKAILHLSKYMVSFLTRFAHVLPRKQAHVFNRLYYFYLEDPSLHLCPASAHYKQHGDR